jgi:hypothetical protein
MGLTAYLSGGTRAVNKVMSGREYSPVSYKFTYHHYKHTTIIGRYFYYAGASDERDETPNCSS